jgi:hypothetical protein
MCYGWLLAYYCCYYFYMYLFLIFLCTIVIEILFSLDCVFVCFFVWMFFFLLLNVVPVLQFCVDSTVGKKTSIYKRSIQTQNPKGMKLQSRYYIRKSGRNTYRTSNNNSTRVIKHKTNINN